VPRDAPSIDEVEPNFLLSWDDLSDCLDTAAAKTILLVADCCRDAAQTDSGSSVSLTSSKGIKPVQDVVKLSIQDKEVLIVWSCAPGQLSYFSPDNQGLSHFTEAFSSAIDPQTYPQQFDDVIKYTETNLNRICKAHNHKAQEIRVSAAGGFTSAGLPNTIVANGSGKSDLGPLTPYDASRTSPYTVFVSHSPADNCEAIVSKLTRWLGAHPTDITGTASSAESAIPPVPQNLPSNLQSAHFIVWYTQNYFDRHREEYLRILDVANSRYREHSDRKLWVHVVVPAESSVLPQKGGDLMVYRIPDSNSVDLTVGKIARQIQPPEGSVILDCHTEYQEAIDRVSLSLWMNGFNVDELDRTDTGQINYNLSYLAKSANAYFGLVGDDLKDRGAEKVNACRNLLRNLPPQRLVSCLQGKWIVSENFTWRPWENDTLYSLPNDQERLDIKLDEIRQSLAHQRPSFKLGTDESPEAKS